MRATLALGLLLAAAVVVDGALLLKQAVTTNPAAGVPVTLAAIGGVNTTLGTSLTTANVGSVTAVTLPILASATNVLTIQRGSANWTVQLKITATSGLIVGDSVNMTLAGATTQNVTVTPSTTLPVTSSTVSLLGTSFGGTNITVKAASGVAVVGGCGGLSTCTLTMQIILTGGGGNNPVATYPFTLRAT